ncbi:MAG: FHA domain-containing protein [Planctomycetota bacterium]
MPYLLTRAAHDASPARVPIPDRPAILGRSRRAAIRIVDPSVSKLHASIEPIAGTDRFRLEDLGSRNGIRYAGTRCKSLEVTVGDEFTLGNVTVTVCGDGPEPAGTLDANAEASDGPRASGVAEDLASATSLWNRAERNVLLGIFLLGGGLGGVALWWAGAFPRREAAPTPALYTPTPAEPTGTSDAVGEVVGPAASTPTPAPVAAASTAVGVPWHALGAELDRTCEGGGCHLATAQLDLLPGSPAEVGRWERNILAVRSRARIERRGSDWWLAEIPGVAAHSRALPLTVDATLSAGIEAALAARGRLITPHSIASPLPDWLDEYPVERLRELRRTTELLLGRRPTLAELARWRSASCDQIVAELRGDPDLWMERSRRVLAERSSLPRSGAFRLPEALRIGVVPDSPAEWGSTIRRIVGAHPARESAPPASARSNAPIPHDDADAEFEDWLAAGRTQPRPVRYDVVLRSLAVALLGRRLDADEELGLIELAGTELEPADAARLLIRTLAYGPALGVPPPEPGQDAIWVKRFSRWIGERDLPEDAIDALTKRLFDGSADPRLFIEEECFGSFVARPPVLPHDARGGPVAGGQPLAVRVEVWCSFPVRELLREPARIPRLWARLEHATLFTFPSDPSVSLAQIQAHAAPSSASTRWVLSHRDPLRRAAESPPDLRHAIWLADGMLTPGLRRLTDRLGEPRVPATAPGLDDWVRGLLRSAQSAGEPGDATAASTPPADAIDESRWETGAYRLRAGGSHGSVYRPAARTLLLAMGELTRQAEGAIPERPTVVWVPMPEPPPVDRRVAGGNDQHWEDFASALDLLSLRLPNLSVDLWLWGPARAGAGTETVRVHWGAGHGRGRVLHESEIARRFHPALRSASLPGPGGAEDESPPLTNEGKQ